LKRTEGVTQRGEHLRRRGVLCDFITGAAGRQAGKAQDVGECFLVVCRKRLLRTAAVKPARAARYRRIGRAGEHAINGENQLPTTPFAPLREASKKSVKA